MNQEYGAVSELVAAAGSLIGAAIAIGLGWLRRARWFPPEEDLPGSTSRISALLCAVAIALLYIFGKTAIGAKGVGLIAGWAVGITVMSLLVCVFLNTAYAVEKKIGKKSMRILTGFWLTPRAKRVKKEFELTSNQQLFDNANQKIDLVWTDLSRGLLKSFATLSYLSLQASGSIGLSAAGILLSFWVADGSPS